MIVDKENEMEAKVDDSSAGAGGSELAIEYEIDDGAFEAMQRVADYFATLQDIEYPAIAGLYEASGHIEAITKSLTQSDSIQQLSVLQKSLATPEMDKLLALTKGVKQAVDSTWVASIGKTVDQVFSNEAFQNMNALSKAMDTNIGVIAETMRQYGRGLVSFEQYGIQADQALAPMMEALKQLDARFDWDGALQTHKTWGGFGWIISGDLTASEFPGLPESWQEANEIAEQYLDDIAISNTRKKLLEIVNDRKDLEEAFWLYDEGHYKPCAMMLMALIDGQLFIKAKRPERGRFRESREPINRLIAEAPSRGFMVLSASGVLEAYEFYFRNAKDFTESRKGELNRNFLMHGMYREDVSSLSCKKLMALLLAVSRLIQYA